jgi:predicted PurR-regulated permease PerM
LNGVRNEKIKKDLILNNTFQFSNKLVIGVVLLVLLCWLVASLEPVLMPFLLGALFGYLGDPIADRLEGMGLSRTLSVVICFTVITLLLLGVTILLVPLLISQVKVAYGHIPDLIEWVQLVFIPWVVSTFGVDADVFNAGSLKNQLLSQLGTAQDIISKLIVTGSASTGSLIGLIANLALVPVVGFYLLRDWDILTAKVFNLFPLKYQPVTLKLSQECNDVVGAFLRGQLWVMAALAVIYGIGLWAVGLKLALLVALIAGIASIVPYMGFAIGIVAAMAAGYVQFGFDYHLILIFAGFLVWQVVESMFLTPILVGDKIGLHPVAVIFAIMAGGQLFGFVGVILALPVAAIIVVLLRHLHEIYKDTEFYSEN